MEKPTTDLEVLRKQFLPDLQTFTEKQKAIVKENPFIAIKDHKTYQQAKKNRTALVSGRTTVQNQEKLIASQLKKFRTQVGEASKELIAITQPHEEKQQEEVKRYETEKEEERLEKERIEQQRIVNITNKINTFYTSWKKTIQETDYANIDACKEAIVEALESHENFDFAEYKDEFNEKVVLIRELFKGRVNYLTEVEDLRKEREKLAKKVAKADAERKAREEAEKKKQEEMTAKKVSSFVYRLKDNGYKETHKDTFSKEGYAVTIDTLKSLNEAEFNFRLKEVDSNIKRDAELKALKEAQAKADAEKKAKEEKEAKAKAAEEEKKRVAEEKKRLKALKPDKEKAEAVIKSLTIDYSPEVTIKDKEIDDLLAEYVGQADLLMLHFMDKLSKIK